MIRFEDIKDSVESYLPEADCDLLRRAYVFSAMKHKNQLRKSGEPYLIHPLEVAHILADLKLDVTTVAVGLLHDILEDTLTTREVMEDTFGPEITHLVEALSKISKFRFRSQEQREAENFRKMMLAVVDDLRVIMVKLADRLHNMRTLQHLEPERQQKISRETIEIYAPIANRLGLGAIKGELEDLTFRYLDPASYQSLTRRLRERQAINDALIVDVEGTLQEKLSGIPVEIQGRVKHLHSIARKMKQQGIDVDEVYDYVAFRIITDSVKNCYGILGIIHAVWPPVPGRIKDYIAMPKPNMYQSLHTSVVGSQGYPFEVQIRTRQMDDIAERGVAAHWKYKETSPLHPEDERGIEWLRQLIDWQQELEDPREFLKAVKVDLYPEEVYVFTPQGQVKSLPRGATPIDFAYRVHTEVGHRCVGSRVNGRLVPLKTELANGDRVEILTSPSAHPSRDWLKIVKTSTARAKIRSWIKQVDRDQSLALGRTMMDRELKRYRVSFRKLENHPGLPDVLRSLGVGDLDDLLVSVGYGKTLGADVIERLFPDRRREEKPRPGLGGAVRKVLGLGADRVEVAGMRDGMVTLAKCCNPVQGEPIVGYVTRGRGVSVHLESCPNVDTLLYDPQRRIDVQWSTAKGAHFEVKLRIQSEDRKGVLARLTSAISEEGANIRDIRAEATEDQRGQIRVTLQVADRKQLDRLLVRLRALQGIRAVDRILG
jgi:GTP pyrophosphokinase